MALTQADKDWIKDALKQQTQALDTSIDKLGKRVFRLETAFGLLARASRAAIVSGAKKNHARLLDTMFNTSDLLALPLVQADGSGQRVRQKVRCDARAVEEVMAKHNDEFEVELTKVGFRLVHSSRSSQRRRKEAAEVLKRARDDFKEGLQLQLQYDKPYELREIQTAAFKFLALLKKLGGELIKEKSVRGGFLIVDGVRLAPEYLVPRMPRWKSLAEFVLERIRGWGGRPPTGVDEGFFTDVFGAEFAADHGVFELNDVVLDEGMELGSGGV
jgi:hypothetical protein